MKTERMSTEAFAPQPVHFVDKKDIFGLFRRVAFTGAHILVGPKGVAKTLSLQAFAHEIDCSIVTVDCSEDVRRSHMMGQFVLRGEETPFVLGPIPTAIEIANERGACMLVFEEINTLTPQMQKVLNPLTDFRKSIRLYEVSEVYSLKPDAKLWVCGTMNTAGYAGIYALNEDLKSRFRFVECNYPSRHDELDILAGIIGEKQVSLLPTGTLQHLVTLAHETRQKTYNYQLSTRDLAQIAEDTPRVGIETALRLSAAKFENEEKESYFRRIGSIFPDITME